MYFEDSLSTDSIDSGQFKLSGKLSPLCIENFATFCRTQIKTNPKNRRLFTNKSKDRFSQSSQSPRLSQFNSEVIEEITQREIKAKRRFREIFVNDHESNSQDASVKLDTDSCFIWWIVDSKNMRDIVPDYEFEASKLIFEEILKKSPDSYEANYGLGKLLASENNLEKSLSLLKRTIEITDDDAYKLWYVVIYMRYIKSWDFKISHQKPTWNCCAGNRKNQGLKALYLELYSLIARIDYKIESLWAMMEISLLGILQEGEEIESPRHYAAKIKDLDTYYSYLAWSQIYTHNKNYKKTIEILQEMIKVYPNRPEAYMKLWELYYYKLRNFENSEDIAAEAFIRVNEVDYLQYYPLFCINYAKSFFKMRKYNNAFELLQQKFIENPNFPVFIYQYGRLIVKSEVYSYIGSAIGALQECLRLCDRSRYSHIYYWLSKGYLLNRQYIEAYQSLKEVFICPQKYPLKKISDMKRALDELSPTMQAYNLLVDELSANSTHNAELLLSEVHLFHKSIACILNSKVLWVENDKEKALNELKRFIREENNHISAYLVLLEYLEERKEFEDMNEIGKEMVKFCNNPNISTFVWIKAHILYAKILVLNQDYTKAIFLLKCLAKVFPPMPYIEIPYTMYLQRATTYQELNHISSEVFQQPESCRIHKDFAPSYKTWHRDISYGFLDNDAAPMPVSSPQCNKIVGHFSERLKMYQNHRKFSHLEIEVKNEDSEAEDGKIVEKLEIFSPIQNGNEFYGFSISSSPIFLYKIAKYSAKFNVNLIDGLWAIGDYVTLLKFEKNVQKRAVDTYKGLYLKCLLLFKNNQKSASFDLITQISPDLFRLNLKSKLKDLHHFLENN